MTKNILTDLFLVYPFLYLLYLAPPIISILVHTIFLLIALIILYKINTFTLVFYLKTSNRTKTQRMYYSISTWAECMVLVYFGMWGVAGLWAIMGVVLLKINSIVSKVEKQF